jgi:hypothetical protein
MANGNDRPATQRAWWKEPAWITLVLAMVAQLLILGYSLGHLNARVELLMDKEEHLEQLLMQRPERSNGR